MQNAIPPIVETPMVSLISELKVYSGQNQIRRNVGFFTNNTQGSEIQVVNKIFQPNDSMTVPAMNAMVLVSTGKLYFTGTYTDGAGAHNLVLSTSYSVWDASLTTVTIQNKQTVPVEMSLIYTT